MNVQALLPNATAMASAVAGVLNVTWLADKIREHSQSWPALPTFDLLRSVNPLHVTLAIVAVLCTVVYWHFSLPGRRFRHIPGPPYRWLIGQLPEINAKQFHIQQLQWMSEYGPIYRYFLGPMPMVVITDPALAKEVCITRFNDFHDRFTLTPTEQTPLTMIFGKGNYWKGIRSAVIPLFHTDKLSSYTPLVNRCLDSLVGEWRGG